MSIIAIEGMTFFSYHGVHEEEIKLGNNYEVDVYLETDIVEAGENDALAMTVNYEEVYDQVKQIMSRRARLIEKLVLDISLQMLTRFDRVTAARVRVSKLNPPVGGVCRRTFVEHFSAR